MVYQPADDRVVAQAGVNGVIANVMMFLDRINHGNRSIGIGIIEARSDRYSGGRIEQSFFDRPAEIASQRLAAKRAAFNEIDLFAASIADVAEINVAGGSVKTEAKGILKTASHYLGKCAPSAAGKWVGGRDGKVLVGVAGIGVDGGRIDVESQDFAI